MSLGCPADAETSERVTRAIMCSRLFICQDARFRSASPCRAEPGDIDENLSTHHLSSMPTSCDSMTPRRALSSLIQASVS